MSIPASSLSMLPASDLLHDPKQKLKQLQGAQFFVPEDTEGTNPSQKNERVKQKLVEFSGALWGILLNEMFATVKVDPVMGGGYAEETFRNFQMGFIGEAIAKSGSDSLTKMISTNFMTNQVNSKPLLDMRS
ncbi:MAG: hypothetical protein KBE16_00870 [Alphaproteobacteria bacterium]|jgi:hypothetical protein|nr:hypothetical protein [Alphaproteobacteria bacterium]MBP9877582.1 hypothetical protein [Alphaproteobacteria bacterium]